MSFYLLINTVYCRHNAQFLKIIKINVIDMNFIVCRSLCILSYTIAAKHSKYTEVYLGSSWYVACSLDLFLFQTCLRYDIYALNNWS